VDILLGVSFSLDMQWFKFVRSIFGSTGNHFEPLTENPMDEWRLQVSFVQKKPRGNLPIRGIGFLAMT
jgi:hypothetical protein